MNKGLAYSSYFNQVLMQMHEKIKASSASQVEKDSMLKVAEELDKVHQSFKKEFVFFLGSVATHEETIRYFANCQETSCVAHTK